MLKDITLGQYFPGNSVVHRLDPRVKLVLIFAFIIILFMVNNFLGYILLAAALFSVVAASGIPFSMVAKSIKPLFFIILLTGVLNIFYTSGDILWDWGFIKITEQGIKMAAFMIIRIVFLIIGTSMLTYTTSPIMLTDAIERLFGPLKVFKVPVHELAMMMSIALRFIPTLIEETQKIMNAQKARGADFESGSIFKRAAALIPILVPLFVSAFRRADELAVAMECRCYRGGVGRTRLRSMVMGKTDYVAITLFLLISASLFYLNTLPLLGLN